MAGLDIYSSQSLFRSGHVLLICVGRSVCHGEGYPNHFGSLWMFPRLSRLPASPCARIKAHFCPRPSYLPHITTAIPKHSTQLSPHPAIYLALSLPAVPYRPSSWPFAAKANSRCHLKEGKHREWWVLAAVNQRYEFRTKAHVIPQLTYRPRQLTLRAKSTSSTFICYEALERVLLERYVTQQGPDVHCWRWGI